MEAILRLMFIRFSFYWQSLTINKQKPHSYSFASLLCLITFQMCLWWLFSICLSFFFHFAVSIVCFFNAISLHILLLSLTLSVSVPHFNIWIIFKVRDRFFAQIKDIAFHCEWNHTPRKSTQLARACCLVSLEIGQNFFLFLFLLCFNILTPGI